MKTFACVALLVIAAAGSAGAQALQRLTVRDFSLSADAARVAVGGTLRVTMRVHVDQPVGELDNVTLPNLSGFDILGDERQCVTAGRGTDCSETLTMSPNAPGTYAIGPVALDSIDPRTNRATHFATNVVSVTVTDNAGGGPVEVPSLLYDVMRQILILAIAAIIVLVLIWGIGLPRRRRTAPAAAPEPPAAAPPPPPPPDPDATLRAAIAALAREPTRPRVLAVRDLLRARAGARSDETLSAVTARVRHDPALVAALAAVERPAFVDDGAVAPAASQAQGTLEALLTPLPTPVSLEVAMPSNITWKPVADGDESSKSELPASAFAFPRERKEPLTDAGHVRSALARFSQVEGVSDDEREQAFANIRAAAEHYGVHVSETSWRDFFKG
jgi:hypothetical protein